MRAGKNRASISLQVVIQPFDRLVSVDETQVDFCHECGKTFVYKVISNKIEVLSTPYLLDAINKYNELENKHV